MSIKFLELAKALNEAGFDVAKRADILEFSKERGYSSKEAFKLMREATRVSFGNYDVRGIAQRGQGNQAAAVLDATPRGVPMFPDTHAPLDTSKIKMNTPAPVVVQPSQTVVGKEYEPQVPQRNPLFVEWGTYRDIQQIISSNSFYPVVVTGDTGNGKTEMVTQACAKNKRACIRIQITPETDETDLVGGFRLVDGNTVFVKGPVIRAMEAGAVALIDELDRGTNKLMCLQGIMEGKPVVIKKTGETVFPSPGFNIIATANTKGKGDETGRFVAANVIDEAFLERFVVSIDQPYASPAIEKKIVVKHLEHYGVPDEDFATNLVTWANIVRDTYNKGGIEDLISTRRLCHIAQTFGIFKKKDKAIAMCVARFGETSRQALIDLYRGVDKDSAKANPTKGIVDDEF